MKVRGVVKSILAVTASNIITILSGIIVGLFLPKILPVNDYGWYKTFTLYTTYTGLFSLGIIDGIVLKYGGKNYDELDVARFRSYFKWYWIIQFFFSLILCVVSIFIRNNDYKFIFIFVAIFACLNNITGYFQQISQITQRFKEYSLRKVIYSFLKILIVGFLFLWALFVGYPYYQIFLILFLFTEIVLTSWYIYTYRNIAFGKALKLQDTQVEVMKLAVNGFPLLFSNLCSTFILSLDRQFVNILFPTDTYAVYAFAYNMLTLVTVAMSAISTVLYPTLKRTTVETMQKNYPALISIVTILVFGATAIYFPLCLFVEWFLPQYLESISIFRIIFPGLAISSSITVVIHNYFKASNSSLEYFKRSVVVILVSALANAIAYFVFHTPSSISIASIITMVFWFIYCDSYFVKKYKVDQKKNYIYTGFMIVIFYLCTIIENYFIGLVFYIALFICVTWIIHRFVIKYDLMRIIKK